MAPLRRKPVAADRSESEKGASAMDMIARLLAVVVTKDMDTDTAALTLDKVGFDARDISMLLSVGPNYVNVARHRIKKKGAKKQRKRKSG